MPWLQFVRGFIPRIQRPGHIGFIALFGLAYANSFNGAFQFDDFNVIVDYAAVHSLTGWLSDVGQGIRPLLKLTYTLNWIIGSDPLRFHAVNLLIHGASVWLVYRLTQEYLKTKNLLPRVALAPCSPFSVTTELLKLSAEVAAKWDVRLHTHLAETLDEEAFCLERHKMRPLAYMESVGWLRGRS